jgi:hypothetical protein
MIKEVRFASLLLALPLTSFAEQALFTPTSGTVTPFQTAAESGQSLAASVSSLGVARSAAEKKALKAFGVDTDEINRPWQIVMQALVDKFQLKDGKYIQFVSAAQPADWSDKNWGVYRTNFYGDTIPKWGATFDPQNASSFSDIYGTFVNSIKLKLPNPADQAAANSAKTKWTNCNTARENEYKLIGKHWKSYNDDQAGLPSSQQKNFQWWFSNFEASALKTYDDQCNSLAINYNTWFNKATQGQGNLANAINRYASAKQVSALIPGTTDQYQSVWPYAFVQSLDDFVAASEAAPNLAFNQTYKKDSGTYSATTSTWGGSASYGWFFHGSAGGSSSTVDTHSDEFALTIQMKGLQVFDVRPGDWFSQQLIQFFAKGPFEPNSVIQQQYNAGTLYGANGVFALRTARYIAAYKPKVVVHMSASNYHEAKSSWSAGGGLSIGCFSFGANASGSQTNISWDDTSNTVTAENSSKAPQVIAVILDVLPDFK